MIPTQRASRYLVQLCKHADAMGRRDHRPPSRAGHASPADGRLIYAEWTAAEGQIAIIPGGICTVTASADSLIARIEAPDEDGLREVQDIITRSLKRFGRRDGIDVTWTSVLPTTPTK